MNEPDSIHDVYHAKPLTEFSVADLTDALTVKRAAELLNTTRRAIYTVRHTNALSEARVAILIDAIRADEERCRQRLIVKRNLRLQRAVQRNNATNKVPNATHFQFP